MKNKQITLFCDAFEGTKTHKRKFLEKTDRFILWDEFEKAIRLYYYKGNAGNQPYEPGLTTRIYIPQNLYDLAYYKTSDEICDNRAFAEFRGIDSPAKVPDGVTIRRFRGILTNNYLQGKNICASRRNN